VGLGTGTVFVFGEIHQLRSFKVTTACAGAQAGSFWPAGASCDGIISIRRTRGVLQQQYWQLRCRKPGIQHLLALLCDPAVWLVRGGYLYEMA
jgi:hypothetical protein